MNTPRPRTVPPWDLPTVLRALKCPPFEPLQSSSLRVLSLKTALLLALASVKRVGDLQALSVNPACLEFGPNDSKVVLKPRLGYVPKVLSTPFRARVITLSALIVQHAKSYHFGSSYHQTQLFFKLFDSEWPASSYSLDWRVRIDSIRNSSRCVWAFNPRARSWWSTWSQLQLVDVRDLALVYIPFEDAPQILNRVYVWRHAWPVLYLQLL